MGSIIYVEETKQSISGFNYRVKLDKTNCPDAILFTTPTMRYHLVRFRSTIFLDDMDRQMNKFSWSYIAPMVNNQEMNIALCSEAIITSEYINTYVWVINMMAEMQPKWSISNIRSIFADDFIIPHI